MCTNFLNGTKCSTNLSSPFFFCFSHFLFSFYPSHSATHKLPDIKRKNGKNHYLSLFVCLFLFFSFYLRYFDSHIFSPSLPCNLRISNIQTLILLTCSNFLLFRSNCFTDTKSSLQRKSTKGAEIEIVAQFLAVSGYNWCNILEINFFSYVLGFDVFFLVVHEDQRRIFDIRVPFAIFHPFCQLSFRVES